MDQFFKAIRPSNIKATSISGETLKIIGKIPLCLTIGKIRLIHQVCILNNTYFIGDILIGKVILSLNKKYIQINKYKTPIVFIENKQSQCFKIQKINIPYDKVKIKKNSYCFLDLLEMEK